MTAAKTHITGWVRAAAIGMLAAVLAGCAGAQPEPVFPRTLLPATSPGPVGAAGGDSCTPVHAPVKSIPALATSEPQLAIPQPAGWERNTMLDSQLIRFALVNKSLIANRFAPTVVVTLESAAGAHDARKLFEQSRSALVTMGGATDLSVKPATLCGQPAEIVEYVGNAMGKLAAHPATVLAVVMQAGGTTYLVTVTIQTTDADNPTYRRDAETILTGFTLLAPAATALDTNGQRG